MFNGFFSEKRAVYKKMGEKKYGRAMKATYHNIIRRTRISCWLTKTTDTHSEYVTLIAFPRQKRLCKRTRMLRYTHVAYLVPLYEGWNFNSGNYLFTTDTK